MQRNNIAMYYGRPEKCELVRLREVRGWAPGEIRKWAAREWPDKPAIHSRTWTAWSKSDDYRDLAAKVLGEQRERDEMTEILDAAGGTDALGDVSKAAAYALACKATRIAASAEDAREIRSLMATAMDASELAADRVREQLEAKHAAEIEHKDAEIARLANEAGKLREKLQRATAALSARTETVDPAERAKLIEAMNDYMAGAQH